MDTLFDMKKAISELPAKLLQSIQKISRMDKIHKGSILINPGEECAFHFYLEQGFARTFYNKAGTEVTELIYQAGDFMMVMPHTLVANPTLRGIQILTDAKVWRIPIEAWDELAKQDPIYDKLCRMSLFNVCYKFQYRTEQLLFNTSQERYELLLQKRPEWVNHVPLGVIASYLGMTQETLSRMRSNR